ncbi:MAG TPA: hypothetical protein VFK36_06540 [Gemmatimonadales bacterium]|jgi:hypothetical protein|nr:hypothetical protein [Gemmatimonadales bacterium]
MAPEDLSEELQKMRAALQAIEQRLQAKSVPMSGVQDLKSGVDELRLRLWAILSASNNPDPQSTLERFRLRRATEILDSLQADIVAGKLRTSHKEVGMLVERAERIIAALRPAAKPG